MSWKEVSLFGAIKCFQWQGGSSRKECSGQAVVLGATGGLLKGSGFLKVLGPLFNACFFCVKFFTGFWCCSGECFEHSTSKHKNPRSFASLEQFHVLSRCMQYSNTQRRGFAGLPQHLQLAARGEVSLTLDSCFSITPSPCAQLHYLPPCRQPSRHVHRAYASPNDVHPFLGHCHLTQQINFVRHAEVFLMCLCCV